MKIKEVKKSNKIKFEDLEVGEVFKYKTKCDSFYSILMKCNFEGEENFAVDLDTGEIFTISSDDFCEKINVELNYYST